MNAKAASTIHSKRRLLQRYGLRVSRDGWDAIADKIRNGRAILLKKDTKSRNLYAVEIGRDNTLIPVVYSKSRKAVVTVLPEYVIKRHQGEIDLAKRKAEASELNRTKVELPRDELSKPELTGPELSKGIIEITKRTITSRTGAPLANIENRTIVQLTRAKKYSRYRLIHPEEKPFTRINGHVFFREINGYPTIVYLQFCGDSAVGQTESHELIAAKFAWMFFKRTPEERQKIVQTYIDQFESALRENGLIWDQEPCQMLRAAA